MTKFTSKLTMGRILVLLHIVIVVCAATAIFLAGINGSLPHSWQANVTIVIGIVGALGTSIAGVIKFLDGSQKYDQIVASHANSAGTLLEVAAPVAQAGLTEADVDARIEARLAAVKLAFGADPVPPVGTATGVTYPIVPPAV